MTNTKTKIEWEEVPGRVKGKIALIEPTLTSYRAKVPGGWVFFVSPHGAAFCPDPDHKWNGASID